MDSPGSYSLGIVPITAAGTSVTTPITGLDGMTAATIQVSLAYGSGGAKIALYVQTSIDGGSTWIDIACSTFTTAGGTRLVNLSGLTPKTAEITPTDGALTDDSCLDGILGDRLRIKVVSSGTYGGSTLLSVQASVR